ncbi:hypothetical protein [Nonomuraea sp. NPDC049695]|uniref:hypothetical protein n=1 Tax=Nonomuraea sp. NPDC049695 TaxID=3154734 RepID=UPI00342150FE
MSIQSLPLKANGHLFSLQGNDEVTVYTPLDNGSPFVTDLMFNCAVCDHWPTLQITADAVLVQDPCPFPDGLSVTITLPVPSGRLLVSDDLRPVYDFDRTGMASLNTALGKAQAAEAMEKLGCAFGSTLNCHLGLYPTGEGTYVIATPSYTEDVHPRFPDSADLANICTDLWAFSLADYSDWQKRGGDPSTLDWSDTVVDVTPGTYNVTYHGAERGFDPDSVDDVIWAHIERIS